MKKYIGGWIGSKSDNRPAATPTLEQIRTALREAVGQYDVLLQSKQERRQALQSSTSVNQRQLEARLADLTLLLDQVTAELKRVKASVRSEMDALDKDIKDLETERNQVRQSLEGVLGSDVKGKDGAAKPAAKAPSTPPSTTDAPGAPDSTPKS
ncbi:MAG: hypothetical protein ACFCBW_00895 [Candidatus Competibacterales bacterium]